MSDGSVGVQRHAKQDLVRTCRIQWKVGSGWARSIAQSRVWHLGSCRRCTCKASQEVSLAEIPQCRAAPPRFEISTMPGDNSEVLRCDGIWATGWSCIQARSTIRHRNSGGCALTIRTYSETGSHSPPNDASVIWQQPHHRISASEMASALPETLR